jgi:CDP-glycerol glycerophosphotransferase
VRIVYNSFHGRYSDSPRAIFESLADASGHEQVWLVDHAHADAFPSDVRAADIESAEATRALESADLLVANTHTEVTWTKAPTTTYVQTWHGTPLKRIHRDVLWAPEGRLDRLDGDVAKWDLLLSPNAESTPRLRSGFRYRGEVLESGYPRNDVLSAPDRDARRDEIRTGLGVPADSRVILYAPTWRDDETFQEGSPEVPLGLDVRQLMSLLGPADVLLVRMHPMMTGRSVPPGMAGVVDASFHPDVRELYLAADVLVTDYSSSMFDFAITGKPIVLFAYDLDRFRDEIRGFYFDLTETAPGPIVTTTEDLASVLAALPTFAGRYADAYAAFAACFTSLEDGRATERLLARLGLWDTSRKAQVAGRRRRRGGQTTIRRSG